MSFLVSFFLEDRQIKQLIIDLTKKGVEFYSNDADGEPATFQANKKPHSSE
jgi:hypothetical protein